MEAAFDSFAPLGSLLRLTHPYAILSRIKLGQTSFNLLEKRRRKQSKIKKSHYPSIRNSCFDRQGGKTDNACARHSKRYRSANERFFRPVVWPEGFASRLLTLRPLTRGLNCNKSYLSFTVVLLISQARGTSNGMFLFNLYNYYVL